MRLRAGLLVVGLAAAGLTGTDRATAQAPAPQEVSWQSGGDSYSSGEGVLGNDGDCAQSRAAYGPSAADLLRTRGWQISSETFTACTGHLVEDYFNVRPDSGGKPALWDWGVEQGGPERLDVITMSFGGNDIGFADLLVDCLVAAPDSWTGYVTLGTSELTGCDPSEQDIRARIDALLDPPRRGCTGTRRSGDAGFDCDLDLGSRRGSIIDFYYDIVTQRLTDRGRLYVVGYPRLFADVDQWPGWVKIACETVKRGDTEKLGRLAEYFNSKLQEAVARANQALGSDRVLFVDRFALYRDGLHELCGTNDDWLNGLLFSRGQGFEIRKETSFHPNTAGHAAVGLEVADTVDATLPTRPSSEIRGVDLQNTTLPANSCDQDGWASSPPIPLRNGEGNAGDDYADDDLSSGYAEVYGVDVAGYGDYDGDGEEDVVIVIGCSAGGTYGDQIAVPLTLDGERLALLGGANIGAVSTKPGYLDLLDDYGGRRLARIIDASIDGRDILVEESYDATGSECQGCHTGRATVRWSWTGSEWQGSLD